MSKEIKCTVCNGDGEIEDNGPKHCTKCGGNGYVEIESKCEHVKDCCYPNCMCNMLDEEDLERLKQERINNLLSDYPQ